MWFDFWMQVSKLFFKVFKFVCGLNYRNFGQLLFLERMLFIEKLSK